MTYNAIGHWNNKFQVRIEPTENSPVRGGWNTATVSPIDGGAANVKRHMFSAKNCSSEFCGDTSGHSKSGRHWLRRRHRKANCCSCASGAMGSVAVVGRGEAAGGGTRAVVDGSPTAAGNGPDSASSDGSTDEDDSESEEELGGGEALLRRE